MEELLLDGHHGPGLDQLQQAEEGDQGLLQRLLGETVRLHFEAPTGLPLVEADAGMIEQVLMNLAVNARDAMDQGGELSIRITSEEVDETTAAANPRGRPGRFVCLQVSDTGCGMNAATLARMFEPFFTTKREGTGLGLAITRRIFEEHHAAISVESEVDRGASFRVFFTPLQRT